MDKSFKRLALAVVGAGTVLATGAVHAQSAGSWLARLGVINIVPQVKSGDLTAPSLPGTQVDIKSDTQVSGGVTYMVTDNVAIDVPISLPFKHDIVGDGAIAGVGKIGEVRVLPITVLGEYRFLEPGAAFRPYAGGGLTYAKFYKARSTAALSGLTGGTPSNPTTLEIDSKLALTLGVGASFSFNERWFVDGHLSKTFLKTRATLSTGQTLDAKLDPLAVGVAVGYRF